MMSACDEFLDHATARGVLHVGQIAISRNSRGAAFALCHVSDLPFLTDTNDCPLAVHRGPDSARELSTWGDDGSFRFVKGRPNLNRGWLLLLENPAALRQALDGFYPAAIGLHVALQNNRLRVQHLRAKLDRQTGMYRRARDIEDTDAQALVREICDPCTKCAKRILWRIRDDVPLADSAVSRCTGVAAGIPVQNAIPLLCQEACNYFVAECRRVAKEAAARAK